MPELNITTFILLCKKAYKHFSFIKKFFLFFHKPITRSLFLNIILCLGLCYCIGIAVYFYHKFYKTEESLKSYKLINIVENESKRADIQIYIKDFTENCKIHNLTFLNGILQKSQETIKIVFLYKDGVLLNNFNKFLFISPKQFLCYNLFSTIEPGYKFYNVLYQDVCFALRNNITKITQTDFNNHFISLYITESKDNRLSGYTYNIWSIISEKTLNSDLICSNGVSLENNLSVLLNKSDITNYL